MAAYLNDPTTQAYILDPLTDYNNQFGVATNQQMWQLLTKGSAVFGGPSGTLTAPFVTISLNTASPATVEQSILQAEFNTTYGYNNPQDACRREAEDINNQNQYLSANGENPLTGTISVSNGAPGTITNTCSINSIISNGTSDTNWAVTNSTGQITSSGTAADNGASSTYAELTDTNNTDGTSSQTQIQSSGPIAQSQTNYAGANETGGITSTSDWLANTAAGVSDNTGISNATVYVPTLVLGNIGGGNDTIQLSGLDTLGLQGSNDFVTDTVGGVTVRIGNSLSESFSGVIGDQLTLSGGDTVSATGGGLIANLSGTANAFTGYGDTANILTVGSTQTLYGNDTIDSSVAATAMIAANFTDTLNGIAGDTVDLAGGDIFTSATGGLRAYLTGHNVFTGSGDTAYLLTPSQGNTIYGNDTIDAEAAGTVAIGINDTDTLTGVSGDVVDLAGGDIFTSTTGGLSAYLTGNNVFGGNGDTAHLQTLGATTVLYGNDTIDASAAETLSVGSRYDADTLRLMRTPGCVSACIRMISNRSSVSWAVR